ncbi:MAG: thiamine pyrophosphate-binding protein, partial [Acidobacteriaceae bacterium]|nr:thiamine pyrophosphate-binding protein [Acidobacteriaceae bacterium]
MIKVSDYILGFLADRGVKHIFMITGGASMHVNESIGCEKRIQYVCNHHEQACAMAAEGYARLTGELGVISVTTGPGAVNTLNGVYGAYTDSVPMLILAGQVRRDTCARVRGMTNIRQLGDQEADMLGMVQGITKYAVLVSDPSTIRYHLEKAYHLATTGRPGPCWLDLPVDVQAVKLDPAALRGYDPSEDDPKIDQEEMSRQCGQVIEKLESAKRPVILAGTGVRAAHATEEFEEVIRKLGIPVTTAWTHDLIASDDELFCGRPGSIGERPGNFTVQNSDVLLVLGSRLNIRQVSYNWTAFAREAFKIQVDVDPAELEKPFVRPDLPIICDLKVFLGELSAQLNGWKAVPAHQEWLAWCRERVARYPVVQPKQRQSRSPLNPYYFIELLFDGLDPDDAVVCANASACIVPYQVARLKKGQRLISNSGSASLGYDLPAAVGAAVGHEGKRVVCLAGDGSIQMNLQELQTVAHHQLPIKIFVLNNGGYLSIRLS